MFLKKRKREEKNTIRKKMNKEYILTQVPFYTSSSIENTNIKIIDPVTRDRATITLIYNLKEKSDYKIYGEKDPKKCTSLDTHIHNSAKFLVQNELYFGCRIVVSGGALVKVLPSKRMEFIYFKTINLYDNIPVYVIFRRYLLEDCKISPISKVYICKLGDTICDFPINNYKKFKFLNKEDFEYFEVKNELDLTKSKHFKALFYFAFEQKEDIFNENTLFLNKLTELKDEFDLLYNLYNYNLCVKNIFITFIEMEKFIINYLPIYFYINKLTSFPFQKFFNGHPLFKAIDFLRLKECFKQNYRIKHPGVKRPQKTKDYIEVFLLNEKYSSKLYKGYLNKSDLITNQGFVVNKPMFEIDIFSAYGCSFLNVYEKEELEEFKVLYVVIKKLIELRKASTLDTVIRVCKLLINAGCYGSLNDVSSKIFPLYPELMIKIIQNTQQAMKASLKFMEILGYRRVFSKLDSHFLIWKGKRGIKEFEKDLTSLNDFMSKDFPNSKFKFKGQHSNGIWFNQNNYVLSGFKDKDELVIKGRLNSKMYPKTIRDFCLDICKKLFCGEKLNDFKIEYQEHKQKTKVTFDNFRFKEKGNFFVYVKGIEKSWEKHNLITSISKNFYIHKKKTYLEYEKTIKVFFNKLGIF